MFVDLWAYASRWHHVLSHLKNGAANYHRCNDNAKIGKH